MCLRQCAYTSSCLVPHCHMPLPWRHSANTPSPDVTSEPRPFKAQACRPSLWRSLFRPSYFPVSLLAVFFYFSDCSFCVPPALFRGQPCATESLGCHLRRGQHSRRVVWKQFWLVDLGWSAPMGIPFQHLLPVRLSCKSRMWTWKLTKHRVEDSGLGGLILNLTHTSDCLSLAYADLHDGIPTPMNNNLWHRLCWKLAWQHAYSCK